MLTTHWSLGIFSFGWGSHRSTGAFTCSLGTSLSSEPVRGSGSEWSYPPKKCKIYRSIYSPSILLSIIYLYICLFSFYISFYLLSIHHLSIIYLSIYHLSIFLFIYLSVYVYLLIRKWGESEAGVPLQVDGGNQIWFLNNIYLVSISLSIIYLSIYLPICLSID